MKKLSLFSGAVILVLASISFAGDFRDAALICESMSFGSSKSKCVANVRSYEREYFDVDAVNICKKISFDSDKAMCIDVIAGKSYEGFEISQCASEVFGSDINSCLKKTGKVQRGRNSRNSNSPGRGLGYQNPPARGSGHKNPLGNSHDYETGTVRTWVQARQIAVPKGIAQEFIVNLDSRRAVSQVRLTGDRDGAYVVEAFGITTSGARISLPNLVGRVTGTTRSIHSQYAARLQSISLTMTTQSLLGSRPKVEVLIGYTR